MLKLVLPKGSLEKATMALFEEADLTVRRSSDVDYKANVGDPRIDEVRVLRPQEIPQYVAEGMFDLGITGRDWIEETSSTVESLGELQYSKATSDPVRIVVAVKADSEIESVADLPQGVRVSSEYPELTTRFFADKGIEADIRLSYGATEAKVPDIVDCIVDITETGRAIRAAGLKIIDTILTSYTELIANPASYADPAKQHAMHQVRSLLLGTRGVASVGSHTAARTPCRWHGVALVVGLAPPSRAVRSRPCLRWTRSLVLSRPSMILVGWV